MRGTLFVQSKGHSDHGGADTDSSGTRAWRAGRLLAIRKRWSARIGEGIPAPAVDALGDFDGGLLVLAIGRASCRERVCLYVDVSVVAVTFKKQDNASTIDICI